MYEEFFGLSHRPFSLSADPRFLYLTPQHREAATGLIYAVLKHKGMVTLTGEPGTGKTTVLRAVLASLGAASVKVAYVAVPTLTTSEFLEFVLLQFGLLNMARANKAERLLMLERFLLAAHKKNKIILLIVDEAHKLSKDLLEEIRLLTNYETRRGMLIQMVLAGQSELTDLLRQEDMHQLKQRVSYRFGLRGLTEAEVHGYIAHRWARAGGAASPPFDDEALRAITLYSQGIPRLINAICDNALVMAFADGASLIQGPSVFEAARDLDLVGEDHGGPVNGRDGAGDRLDDLELLVMASNAANGSALPALDRQSAPPKESWVVRSARKLLVARQPDNSHE
jgi:general secretion pathway protein A